MSTALEGLKIEQWPKELWEDRHYNRNWMSASRGAGAMGFGQFSSPLEEYSSLRGDIPRPDTSLPMMLGHLLEPAVATLYAAETGRKVEDPGDYAVIIHPELPWLFATLDRVTFNEEGVPGAVELKTTNSFARSEWIDGAPVPYQIQNQIQMMCADLPWGSLACLIGNSDFLTHDFLRDETLGFQILTSLDKFHNDVIMGKAPSPTWQDGAIIKALHPADDGSTAVIHDRDYVRELCVEFEAIKGDVRDKEKQRDELKFKILAEIGDSTFMDIDESTRYSAKTQTRKEHTVKESTFRVLRKMK